MNNHNDFNRDEVLALANINDDRPSLTMAPLRRQLSDGDIRTFEDLLGFILHLGCRAGRAGLNATGGFLLELLTIPDLTDAEITLLWDLTDALGCGGEDE